MRYLVYCAMSYATNNALEENVSNLVRSYDRLLIEDDTKLEQFKVALGVRIAALDAQHSRCKPVVIQFEAHNKYGSSLHQKDLVARWNNVPNTNGKHLAEIKILAIKEDSHD